MALLSSLNTLALRFMSPITAEVPINTRIECTSHHEFGEQYQCRDGPIGQYVWGPQIFRKLIQIRRWGEPYTWSIILFKARFSEKNKPTSAALILH